MTRHGGARADRCRPFVAALVMVLVGTGGAAGTAVAGGSATAAVAVTRCQRAGTPDGLRGAVPSRAPGGCATVHAGASTAHIDGDGTDGVEPDYNGGEPPLLYGGGTLVGTPTTVGENTVHALFWAPAGHAFPAGYEAGIDTYLGDVAAASGTASNVYSVASQYTEGSQAGAPHVHYDVHVGAPVVDNDPYPSTDGCTPDSAYGEGYTACLTDQQLQTELAGVLTTDGLPDDDADIYLMVLPPLVEACAGAADDAADGECSDTNYPGFCAYHSSISSGSAPGLYAAIPFPTAYYYSCLTGEDPNGSPALDAAVNLISHEHNETVTDPFGDAWIDTVGNEEADECAWTFGSPLGGSAGAQWNQVIDGGHYYLQEEFSNEDFALDPAEGCTQSQVVPVAALHVTTAVPAVGIPVSFDGSSSSDPDLPDGITAWSWEFGDGSAPSAGVQPAHVYTVPGTYQVTLTVTDADGFTGTATRAVTVVVPSAPSFTSASPPRSATAGSDYRATFVAAGSPPPSLGLSDAPAWLTIGAQGTVTGTPPAGTESFSYVVTATNGVGPEATVGPFLVTVSQPAPAPAPAPEAHGYWLVGSDGGIFSFGSAGFHGSTGSLTLSRPVVGISPTADRAGYWLVASDGGVFAFGDAGYYGSLPGLGFAPAGDRSGRPVLAAPIVAMVPSTDDRGYFMVAADGGVFAFGDARFAGSCPAIGGCSGAAVAVEPDASGDGYWLITVTGNVYAFGDAPYLGSPVPGPSRVTSAVRTPDGRGYWVLFADGTVLPFGDAVGRGDPAGSLGTDTATAIVATGDGGGYWVDTASGAVDPFGDAPAEGSMAGDHLNGGIIAASGW